MDTKDVLEIPLKVFKDFKTSLKACENKYGSDFDLLNGISEENLNFSDFIDAFTTITNKTADVTIDSNANSSGKDIRCLMKEKGKAHDKLFALNKLFIEMKQKFGLPRAREWLEAEYNGSFYLHDACTATYMGYCYAYDVSRLAKEGLFFFHHYNNLPPKHLSTFADDVIEYISFMSNQSSGAVGLPNLLVWTMWFWLRERDEFKDPYKELKQTFQKLIYKINQPFMRVNETAFVNVSIFDREYAMSLFGGMEFPDGTFFVDYLEEFMKHQKIFMEMISETRKTNMFTFPVITYSLKYVDGKFCDEEFARWASNHNVEYCDANFFVSEDVTTLSNCCRLLSDTSKLGFINSIGGTSLSVGSVKVNTINLVRIALETRGADDWESEYLKLLRERAELCCDLLTVQREIIRKNISKGLLPNYCEGGVELNRQYSTMGILGLYETIREFGYISSDGFGSISYTENGIELAKKIFDVLNEVRQRYEKGFQINIESVPAERAAVILAEKDNLLFHKDEAIYSNQWIPLKEKCSIQEKLRLSSILDPLCSGGAIAHINIETRFPNEEVAWEMLNRVAKSGVIYFAFNTKINVCKHFHAFFGSTCPQCGEEVWDQFTRVVGFLTPTKSWSSARHKEFSERKWYEFSDLKFSQD